MRRSPKSTRSARDERRLPRRFTIASVIAAVALLTGCGTIIRQTNDDKLLPKPTRTFAGVEFDTGLVGETANETLKGEFGFCCVAPLCLLDIPLSAIADVFVALWNAAFGKSEMTPTSSESPAE